MSASVFLQRFGGSPSEEELIQTESTNQSLSEAGGAAAFINKFAGVSESHFFYNDSVEIRFDRVEHKYFRVGELGNLVPLLNVSTVSKIIDRSPALIPWAAKVTVEKFLRIIPTVQQEGGGMIIPPMPFEKFSELAMEAKKAHSDNLEDAGDVGKMAHDWLEQYIKAVMAEDHTTIQGMMTQMCRDQRASNCVIAALDWMKAHNVRWLSTEHKVYSKKHDCCGTFDGICITDSCTDPSCCPMHFKDRKTLIDWKTSNYLYIEFIYQASAYKAFHLEEFPNDTIEDIWILRLGKEDGEFQPWHLYSDTYESDFAGFIACLTLKKKATELEERMKEERAKIRTVKKKIREEARAKAKEEEKIAKAAERARLKAEKAAEREKLKIEAKAERERIKTEKKAAKNSTGEEKYENHNVPVGSIASGNGECTEGGDLNSRAQTPSEGSGQADQTCHERAVQVPEVQSPTALNFAAKMERANVIKVESEQPRPTFVVGGIKMEQEQPSRPVFNIPTEG